MTRLLASLLHRPWPDWALAALNRLLWTVPAADRAELAGLIGEARALRHWGTAQ